jgi:hypothetical protein
VCPSWLGCDSSCLADVRPSWFCEADFFALAMGVARIGMGRAMHGMRRAMEWQHGIFGLMELSAGTAGGRAPGGDSWRVA